MPACTTRREAIFVGVPERVAMKSRCRLDSGSRWLSSTLNRVCSLSKLPPPVSCTRWLPPPPRVVLPALTLMSKPSVCFFRITLITPAIASEP
ncbi:hypothetical protein D3C72_2263060 [compost metagenome]